MHVDQKVRTVHAAQATGLKVNSLKHWIAKGKLDLFSEGQGWREFTLWDINLLAIFSALIQHGVPVKQANTLAREIVTRRINPHIPFEEYSPISPLMVWNGQFAFVFRKDSNWHAVSLMIDPEGPLDEVLEKYLPEGNNTIEIVRGILNDKDWDVVPMNDFLVKGAQVPNGILTDVTSILMQAHDKLREALED